MKHLKVFNNEAEYNEAYESGALVHPTVSYIRGKKNIKTFPAPENDVPLYIEALEDLTVSISTSAIEYSLDNESWVSLASNTASPTIVAGNRVYLRDTNPTTTTSAGMGTFTITGACNIGGNIMSLIYGEDYRGQTSLLKSYQFYKLFSGANTIVDASRLSLPATTLKTYCYTGMFQDCTSLVNVPELPATELQNYCYGYVHVSTGSVITYNGMFQGCTSLINAPELPATTLAEGCYGAMFYGCTSLVNAPELPATELQNYCYSAMFSGCTSLVNAPELPATTLAEGCYGSHYKTDATSNPDKYTLDGMFQGCTSLVNGPKILPATTLFGYIYNKMFYGCTSLVNAPELPATELQKYCYSAMFSGCTSLVNAPELPATALISYCYNQMFYNCKALKYIKAMFTTTPSSSYLSNWVSNVSPGGTFVKNSEATWNNTFGGSAIPSGWTVELADA